MPFVREEQQKRLRAAERELAMLGTVNPLALEEFSALEERHRFLGEQLEDLKRTRKDLLDIVREVDARVEQVFTEAYVDVERAFEETFTRLFPGGEGRLVLTDPDDMLNTGIEVEARPPGKKIKRLSLLSGGERSLVAVAFLVALFKARPSPFYILDEVEAALDDTNLGRLLEIYEELRENSQLLVITHQKRTMEVGDALYGVSMRGDGVSAVISQRLREAVAESGLMPAERPTRDQYVHWEQVTTRWADIDVYGHMNNARYFEIIDTVVNNHLEQATGTDIRDAARDRRGGRGRVQVLRRGRLPGAGRRRRRTSRGSATPRSSTGSGCSRVDTDRRRGRRRGQVRARVRRQHRPGPPGHPDPRRDPGRGRAAAPDLLTSRLDPRRGSRVPAPEVQRVRSLLQVCASQGAERRPTWSSSERSQRREERAWRAEMRTERSVRGTM